MRKTLIICALLLTACGVEEEKDTSEIKCVEKYCQLSCARTAICATAQWGFVLSADYSDECVSNCWHMHYLENTLPSIVICNHRINAYMSKTCSELYDEIINP